MQAYMPLLSVTVVAVLPIRLRNRESHTRQWLAHHISNTHADRSLDAVNEVVSALSSPGLQRYAS